MATPQKDFLETFKVAFEKRFNQTSISWSSGQKNNNRMALLGIVTLRRNGEFKKGEHFELGDLRTDLYEKTIIIEFDSDGLSTHNLIKFWPYLTGCCTNNKKPLLPVLFCHFSNWYSYGSNRDLWNWTLDKIHEDTKLLVSFQAKQFDHGENDPQIRQQAIQSALDWINDLITQENP